MQPLQTQAEYKQPTPDEAWALIQYYDNGHHVEFVQDVLGRSPWSKQSEIISDVFKYPVVAVKSCNAAGKSDLASDVALAFLMCKPNSIVITTAPTWRQVKDVIWRYIRGKHAKAPVKLSEAQCNQVGLDLSEEWFAVGLSTKDSEKFFGYHADDILVIIDEASGVEEEIWVGVDAVTPNLNAHVLAIGNPTNPDGRFYRMFQDPLVKKHTITVFDTPNFTANGIHNIEQLVSYFTPPMDADSTEQILYIVEQQKKLKTPIPALISPMTVYRRYIQWGTEHPMWEALIMAEFPTQASTSLIPLGLIMKSMDVWKQIKQTEKDRAFAKEVEKKPEWNIRKGLMWSYGVDVARFGDDSTVLFPTLGGMAEKPHAWSKVDLTISVDRILEKLSENKFIDRYSAILRVDDIGVGGGVSDMLNKLKRDNPDKYFFNVHRINFSAGTSNPDKWFNLRTEIYDKLAQMFIDHEIAIPDDEELAAELATIRVKYVGKDNQIKQVEAKADIKARLKRSPDKADALAMAMFSGGASSWKDIPEKDKVTAQATRPVTADLQSYSSTGAGSGY
jgi:phage terminase large subunit